MSERTDQLTRSGEERGVDEPLDGVERDSVDGGLETVAERGDETGGVRRWFSPRFFLLSAVLLAVALVGGSTVPVFGRPLGLFVVAFALGLVSEERRYAEVGLAGVAVGGVGSLLRNAVLTLTGVGLPLVVVSAVIGGVAALAGVYFGRDLRDGLTREI
ncbi:DUF456 domain-containing protein [Halostella sp. JP-L12]|uniref:DUF456 domain-containing protein n=1 Tax=Halostella TaxID=1843185 RepID=UPI000EF80A71|nr:MULTISPECIES: DUF456 domain-containing protein [Halostella]NHN47029.1 DUF456 domain-containing protein [Halostella sp. JP-L12]